MGPPRVILRRGGPSRGCLRECRPRWWATRSATSHARTLGGAGKRLGWSLRRRRLIYVRASRLAGVGKRIRCLRRGKGRVTVGVDPASYSFLARMGEERNRRRMREAYRTAGDKLQELVRVPFLNGKMIVLKDTMLIFRLTRIKNFVRSSLRYTSKARHIRVEDSSNPSSSPTSLKLQRLESHFRKC